MDLRAAPGFIGTNANLLADITLVAYILLLLPLMIVGYMYARRKMFEPQHKMVMTTITLLNWVLILIVMVASFAQSVAPSLPDGLNQNFVLIPTVHASLGLIAQVLATYLLARMWLENQLPAWAKIRNIKIYMRVTLSLWIVTALLGITLYFVWYGVGVGQTADDMPPPVATDEAQADATPEPEAPVTTPESDESDTEPEPTLEPTEEEPTEPVATDEPVDASAEDAQEPVATDEPADEDVMDPVSTDEAPEPVTTPETSGN